MSFVKNKLKVARDALGKKDYPGARDAALQTLEYEPENYTANVFLGLALLELGDFKDSEQAYRRAIDLNPGHLLAWQGLSKYYERAKESEKYADTLHRLANIYSQNDDPVKCAETLQRLIEFRREQGTRSQVVEALYSLLPESPLYSVLSTLPPPDPTKPTSTTTYVTQAAIYDSLPVLEEIVALIEKDEDETMKKEVEKRRMRLDNAGPEQLRKDVGREIWGASKLPSLYHDILNHPNTSDDLRRTTDSKLLYYKQRYLHSLPMTEDSAPTKAKVLAELEELVNGAIMLGIPDELAWKIFLEGKDCDTIAGYDFAILQQFMEIFPSLPLTAFLGSYFIYMGIVPSESKGEGQVEHVGARPDLLDVMLDAHTAVPDSIIANRILAEIYVEEVEYQHAIKVAESGIELLRRAELNNGKKLSRTRMGFDVILATSLVHLFPPKHHTRALRIIDNILTQVPESVACLMGRAYILQEARKWEHSGELFARVVELVPDNLVEGLRAREERAWCQIHTRDVRNGIVALQSVLDVYNTLEDRDTDKARCLWRLGKSHREIDGGKHDEAFRYFIMSLKCNPSYAPAFTSLGIHYSDFSTPPDPTRASKCFQKAFELDAREAEAARRLAEGFAEEREWDLVEVVARRAIDGEGGLNAGLKGDEGVAAGRYLPTNAWAWKAIGVVELTRRNYSLAIQNFQIALRADEDDYISWLRLGEAYSKAGRHAAAAKALGHAHELQPDDWMCSYLIGEVQRQTGQFKDAIESFELILADRPFEVGVQMSLGQSHLDLGRAELSAGFAARAERSFVACVYLGLRTIQESPGFRAIAWKIVADAIFFISTRSSFIDDETVRPALLAVISLISVDPGDRLSGILSLSFQDDHTFDGTKTLDIAVAAYNYRISLDASENQTAGSAWFDLGVALHSWAAKTPVGEKQRCAENKAISCLKEALRGDPGNDMYWNALGNANFSTHPKTAQHAYIKALEIDSKNAITWANLGLLYFHNDDLELANEALYRAQTLDPDCTMAWVGQALVATGNGHDVKARTLFEHAVSLTVDMPSVDLEFASRVFTKLNAVEYGHAPSIDDLLPAFFVLDRCCKRRPDDASTLHLFGLICERLGQLEFGANLIERAISILEAAYEEMEDPEVERQFIIANSNMARLRLGLEDYQGAIDSFESALGLLSDPNSDATASALYVQAQFGSGLAHFKLGELEVALDLFGVALEAAGGNPVVRGQVMVLLAQTFWAMGTEEFRETAKAQLLECITTDPENLMAINALTGMGILTNDNSLIDAALSEILTLPLERRRELDPRRDINYLLTQHHLGQGDVIKALSLAQGAMFAEPAQPDLRKEVGILTLQRGEFGPALAILSTSFSASEKSSEMDGLRAIAESLNSRGNPLDTRRALKQAQRAIMLSPSELRNWQTLTYVQSQAS